MMNEVDPQIAQFMVHPLMVHPPADPVPVHQAGALFNLAASFAADSL
jgi:hypothetical protein